MRYRSVWVFVCSPISKLSGMPVEWVYPNPCTRTPWFTPQVPTMAVTRSMIWRISYDPKESHCISPSSPSDYRPYKGTGVVRTNIEPGLNRHVSNAKHQRIQKFRARVFGLPEWKPQQQPMLSETGLKAVNADADRIAPRAVSQTAMLCEHGIRAYPPVSILNIQ